MTYSVYATAPFDHAKADIILRSSDNTDFRVFKLLLSLASPFFETLFEIPQPAEANEDQELKDGLAVIPVAEDSKSLDALLRFCYPCTLTDDPKLEVLKDAVSNYSYNDWVSSTRYQYSPNRARKRSERTSTQ